MISIKNIKYNKEGQIKSCDIEELSIKEKDFSFGPEFNEMQKGFTPPNKSKIGDPVNPNLIQRVEKGIESVDENNNMGLLDVLFKF